MQISTYKTQMHLERRYHTHCIAPAFPIFSFSCFSLPEANSPYLEYSAETSLNSGNGRKAPYSLYTNGGLGYLKNFTAICFYIRALCVLSAPLRKEGELSIPATLTALEDTTGFKMT